MSNKTALITGITGQDGSYLAELLLRKGYRVYGVVRRASTDALERLEAVVDDVVFVDADLLDQNSLIRALDRAEPDEVYNLAAQSFVPTSWEQPISTGEFTALGVTRVLEALRQVAPKARFYQASSSEMFGHVREVPQTERTPFYPRSPYGVAKLYGHWITVNYRESFDMHVCSGILFNHESPRRGREFVTRKVSAGAASVATGRTPFVAVGNLDARRDWGFAGDYVQAMWLMLNSPEPGEYVIATGVSHTVRELCETAFSAAGIRLEWRGGGLSEEGVDVRTGAPVVRVDQEFYRPAEVDELLGDPSRARDRLGWSPTVKFAELVAMMVEHDLHRVRGST